MRKVVTGLAILVIAGLILAGCVNPSSSDDLMFRAGMGPGWNHATDSVVMEKITPVENKTRNDASGLKITSNAHSADFPGIIFVWDPKQNGNGYLKVEEWVFDKYEYFVITTKEANKYWDFKVEPNDCQQMTADNCYVFFIARQEKNINMVFISEWKEKQEKPPIPVLYQIDIVAGPGGSIVTGTSGLYEAGTRIEIEAVADAHYRFVEWTCTDGELEDADWREAVFIVPNGNATVTASFKIPAPTYKVHIIVDNFDQGYIVKGGGQYEEGVRIEIEAAARPGYKFVNWTTDIGELEDANSIATTYVVPDRDVEVIAYFAPADPVGESYLRIKANPTVSVVRNGRYVFELELSDDIPLDRVVWSIGNEIYATVDQNGNVATKNLSGITQLWARDPVTGLSAVIVLRIQ